MGEVDVFFADLRLADLQLQRACGRVFIDGEEAGILAAGFCEFGNGFLWCVLFLRSLFGGFCGILFNDLCRIRRLFFLCLNGECDSKDESDCD